MFLIFVGHLRLGGPQVGIRAIVSRIFLAIILRYVRFDVLSTFLQGLKHLQVSGVHVVLGVVLIECKLGTSTAAGHAFCFSGG